MDGPRGGAPARKGYPPPGERLRRALASEPFRIGIIPALLAAGAILMVIPWLPEPTPGGDGLERYYPTADGDASIVEVYGADGEPVHTEGRNLVEIPALRTFTELRQGIREALESTYDSPQAMRDVRILESRRRTVSPSGEVTESVDTLILEPRGLYLLGSREGVDGTEQIFDPPILLLPADLAPGSRWSSEGSFAAGSYRLNGGVVGSGAFEGPAGRFDDCLRVEVNAVFSGDGGASYRPTFEERYCAGVGLVESREVDGSGELVSREVAVSSDRGSGTRPPRLPPVRASTAQGAPPDPEGWTLAPFGRLRPTGEALPGTVLPTYAATERPVVLAAAYDGDLVALDAGSENPGAVRWRFHTDGTVYGQPSFDEGSGRVYFGATDKRLYAIDVRGLFLWAFETPDNVATRPIVAGDNVVFGCEDGSVYGLDSRTGEERWRVETGGPVASSPALAEGVVALGSDDGSVYGLDPATGEERWRYATGGPVEAPVAAADGTLYAASRSGEITALQPRSGREVWTSPTVEILRTEPAVGGTRLFAVDDLGGLTAFDRETGMKLWEKTGTSFVGPPLIVGDELLVAGSGGHIHRFGLDGEDRGAWDEAAAGNPIDGDPNLSLGPVAGGGAVWATTTRGAVVRMGPPEGPARLEPAWAVPFSEPPLSGEPTQYTAVPFGGEALLLGNLGGVYAVEVETGEARAVGTLDDRAVAPTSEPVVVGETMLAAAGEALYALRLPGAGRLWRSEGGVTSRPPVVADERVLWAFAQGDGERGVLQALDRGSGERLWEASLRGPGGGVVVRGETAYANPASAYDLGSGRTLWSAAEGVAAGGPALDATGETVFAAGADGEGAHVAAYRAEDGEELWRSRLDEAPKVSERLWVVGEVLVVPTGAGRILGLDRTTGEEVWRYDATYPRLGNVTVAGEILLFALQNGELLALEATSGEVLARSNDYALALTNTNLAQRPVVVGDRVVLGVGTYALGFETPERTPR